MEEKKYKLIQKLEELNAELSFLSSAIAYMDMKNFQLNSNDTFGLSLILDRLKDDIKKSIEVLY